MAESPVAAARPLPETTADVPAVTAGVNELIRDALRPATLISALLLSVFAVSHYRNLPAPINGPMAAFTALSALACFGLRFHLDRRQPALGRMNRWSAGLAGIIGLNSCLMLYLRQQPDETVTLMLIMIGAGFLLPSHRWFTAVVIGIVLSWGGVAWQVGWGPLWVNYGFTLLIGTGVAGLLHVVWTRTLYRMVGLRLKLEKRQEELAHSEARFRQLTEAAAEGVVIHVGGRVRDANPAFARMVGRPLADLLGQSIFDLVPPEWHAAVEQHVRSGSEQLYEAALIRSGGSPLPVEIMGRPSTFQGEPARVAIVHDLTARRQADAARQQAEEQLRRWAQELRDRNQAMDLLAEMGEMLQAANTLEQAQAIIAHYAGQLFPDCSGALYLLRASRNLLEMGVSWGPLPPPEPDFAPEACWALRR
ncbi:MAG: PAS domain S-box protein, partial [Anaerolineales bacterium]|nr:PAS domain S-box protein [Anaerolineales bacterium]